MLEQFAQKIADATKEVIGYDVIITNEKSIIIGANDSARVGTFHEGSVEVIKTGRGHNHLPGYIDHMEGTLPGYTLPVVHNSVIIGTIGITGDRSKVENYGLLVKKYAEMMIREEKYWRAHALSEIASQNLIKEILAFDPLKDNRDLLISRGNELGYNLTLSHVAIAIDVTEFRQIVEDVYDRLTEGESGEIEVQSMKHEILSCVKSIFGLNQNLCVPMGSDKFVVLKVIQPNGSKNLKDSIYQKCMELVLLLKKKKVNILIGIGSRADSLSDLSRSYRDAWYALEIGKKVCIDQPIIHIDDVFFESIISTVDLERCQAFVEYMLGQILNQSDGHELVRTITHWCESGFRPVDAAQRLHIHRNTLSYRLEKIGRITGINMRDYKGYSKLYMAVTMINLSLAKFNE